MISDSIKELSTEPPVIREDPETITLAAGEFEDPVQIVLPPGNDTRTKTVSGQLNSSFYSIWYSVVLDPGSIVRIELTPASDFDPVDQDIFYDVLSPQGEYIGGSYDDFSSVLQFEFPVTVSGGYMILVSGADYSTQYNFPFVDDQKIDFDLKVSQFPGGAGPVGGKSIPLVSKPTKEILGILNFFVQQGYVIDPLNGSYDLQRLNPLTSPNYPKAIASAVFGLLRGGDYMAHVGLSEEDLVFSPAGDLNQTLPFFQVSRQLVRDTFVRNVRLDDTADTGAIHRLFYDSSQVDISNIQTNGGPIVFSLQDNIYMLLAMLEVRQYIQIFENEPTAPPNIVEPGELVFYENLIQQLADSIVTYFSNGTYFFDYVSSTVGIPTTNDGNFTTTGNRDFSYDKVSLESLALMAEVIDRVDELLATDHSATINQIVNFMVNNMMVKSVNYAVIEGAGIGVEYVFLSNLTKSDTATLLGNTFLASILTNDTARFRTYANLTMATEIATNILTLMTSSVTGMLYDRVSLSSTIFRKTSTLLNMMQYVNYLNRLSNSWRSASYLAKVAESVARTWQIRSLTLELNIDERMFDTIDNAFFAQYDEDADLLLVDDENYEQNQFIANAMAIAQQIKLFPVNVAASGQADSTVGVSTQIAIKLTNLFTIGSWVWFDPKIAFEFDLTLSIDEFGYSETRRINLFDLVFGGGPTPESVTTFIYEPTQRGRYNITIEATKEGRVLLSQSFELKAYGEVQAELNTPLSFSTDDTDFSATFSLVDENGLALQNLLVEASLGEPLSQSAKFKASDRSDSSGEVSLSFDVTDFESTLVNRTQLAELPSLPKFLVFQIFANVTNLESMNLKIPDGLIVIEVKVELARTVIQISPSSLSITQGTTESYSFEVDVFNQNFEPVQTAKVEYVVNDYPLSRNSVTTDVDGAATITLQDALLVQLKPPSVNITFKVTHSRYPNRTIIRPLVVRENSINIIANPVQYSIKGKTLFESSLPAIDVEVMTEDLFGRSITSMISLAWSDPKINKYVDVVGMGERISPQTFTLDPTNLPAGSYELQISAWREGLVSKDSPIVVSRTIIITEPTLYDSVASAIIIYGVYILSKVGGVLLGRVKKLMGITIDCPHCFEETSAKAPMCSKCGNSIKKG